MPSKTEEYLALAQRTANGLTRYWESWTDYLTTASRLYKYSFSDQLMIYAQRPDATACADYDIWNNRMNRYVRRGSKGIALLDESSGYPRLHYVFDVSDTGVRRNSRDPERWEMNDDLFKPVSEMLTAEYGISHERLSQQLVNIAEKLVNDYWDNNSGDILNIVDGSFFDDYDSSGKELQFKAAATMSVTYTLLERCGFEPEGYFDKDDFQAIHTFSTPDAVYALGAATSDISREVLRTVERAVKTTIRRRNNERSQHEYEQQSELHADRGLSSPEPDPASAKDPAGQVRQDAPELSETAAPGAVPHDAPEREPVPDSDRTGADRSSNEGADDSRSAGEEPGTGQREEPDSVGAAHEQPAGAGRGSDSDGTDLQLSLLDAVIPIEAQQIEHLPIGSIIRLDDRNFRVDHVNFMFKSVSLQDMDLTNSGQPIFRSESLPHIRELYEQQQNELVEVAPEKNADYKVGDEVVVDLPTRTIEGKIGYIRHFISLIRKCKNPTEIFDSMFNELVDKIVVYEAEGAGNARTQKVDIYFNYVGQVDIAYTEEELAELKAQKEQEERQHMEKQRKREKAYREKRKAKKIAENGGEIIKTKTCPHCGKIFTPTSNRQIFCSRDCWNQARQEQKEAAREAERGTHYYRQRACAVCGHSYWPTHSQQEFCSEECRRINHNRKTLEFYYKKKGNPKPDPEAVPTPKPKEDNAA